MNSESTNSRQNSSRTNVFAIDSDDATDTESTLLCSNSVLSDSRREDQAMAEFASVADDLPMPSWLYLCTLNEVLSVQLRPELFRKSSHPDDPFQLRETQEALRFYDDYLPDHAVHILRRGQDVLLRVRLTQDAASPFTIHRIVALSAKVEDEETVELDTVQTGQGETTEAVALLRPSDFDAGGRLNAISPFFGPVDQVNLLQSMYVKIVRPRTKLRLRRLLRMFVNQDQHNVHD